ncbi:MAG TPA: hypothetical protein VGP09_08005 [Caballeronia sp.]|nr:hypothetical protein [Caballeronia sp.]
MAFDSRMAVTRKAPPFDSGRIRYAYGLTAEEIGRGVYAYGEGITARAL